jgi:hypothetical protein
MKYHLHSKGATNEAMILALTYLKTASQRQNHQKEIEKL